MLLTPLLWHGIKDLRVVVLLLLVLTTQLTSLEELKWFFSEAGMDKNFTTMFTYSTCRSWLGQSPTVQDLLQAQEKAIALCSLDLIWSYTVASGLMKTKWKRQAQQVKVLPYKNAIWTTSVCLILTLISGQDSVFLELPQNTDSVTLLTWVGQISSCLEGGLKPQALVTSTKQTQLRMNAITLWSGQLTLWAGGAENTWASHQTLVLGTLQLLLDLTCLSSAGGNTLKPKMKLLCSENALARQLAKNKRAKKWTQILKDKTS